MGHPIVTALWCLLCCMDVSSMVWLLKAGLFFPKGGSLQSCNLGLEVIIPELVN